MESRRFDKNMLIGVVLVGFGALFLMQTFGIISFLWHTLWGLAFLGGSALFLTVFMNDKRQWWAVFPAAGLAIPGLAILLPNGAGGIMGTIVLALLGAAFIAVHTVRPEQVWPIIPGGVLLTLAGVTLFETLTRHHLNSGALFFFGLAATFVAVWYRAFERRHYSWALIVAAVLGAIGTLVLIGSMITLMFKIVLPVALILIGIYALTEGRFFKR